MDAIIGISNASAKIFSIAASKNPITIEARIAVIPLTRSHENR
jgi:hypothetical protein